MIFSNMSKEQLLRVMALDLMSTHDHGAVKAPVFGPQLSEKGTVVKTTPAFGSPDRVLNASVFQQSIWDDWYKSVEEGFSLPDASKKSLSFAASLIKERSLAGSVLDNVSTMLDVWSQHANELLEVQDLFAVGILEVAPVEGEILPLQYIIDLFPHSKIVHATKASTKTILACPFVAASWLTSARKRLSLPELLIQEAKLPKEWDSTTDLEVLLRLWDPSALSSSKHIKEVVAAVVSL